MDSAPRFSAPSALSKIMLVAADVQTQVESAGGAPAQGHWREVHSQPVNPPPPQSSQCQALLLRCRAAAALGMWSDVEMIASSAAATYQDEPRFVTQWAWALHRQRRTVEAFELVARIADRFPRSVAVAYSMACLNGAMKRADEARSWLTQAIARASNPDKVKLRSLIQPELLCLWSDPKPTTT